MKTIKSSLLILSAATLLLAGCATATPYQAMQKGQGYSEQQLEANRFRVRFAGNRSTSRDTVQNYLLYRAAEVTLAQGHDYFVTVDQQTEKETRQYQTFSFGTGFGQWYSYPFGSVGVSNTQESTEFMAEASILTFAGEKPADNPNAFDARQIKANLEGLILRPQPKSGS